MTQRDPRDLDLSQLSRLEFLELQLREAQEDVTAARAGDSHQAVVNGRRQLRQIREELDAHRAELESQKPKARDPEAEWERLLEKVFPALARSAPAKLEEARRVIDQLLGVRLRLVTSDDQEGVG